MASGGRGVEEKSTTPFNHAIQSPRRFLIFFAVVLAPTATPYEAEGQTRAQVQAQTGTPLFKAAPVSPMAVGIRPLDVVLADLNSDGHLDIVTANVGSRDVTVLLNNGHGRFAASRSSPIPTGMASHLVAVADFNGDDSPDLAITAHASNDVAILLSDGKGGFLPSPGSPYAALQSSSSHNHGLLLGDMNGDGHDDVVTANSDDNSVSVLLGDGRGGLAPAAGSPFAVGRRAYMPAIGDVNGDDRLDIAVPNFGDDTVSVLLGNGQGALSSAPGSPFPVQQRPYCTALGDLNADGALDLVVTHADTSFIVVLLGDGDGGFDNTPGSPVDAGQRGYRLRLVDVNADGRTDLVTGTAGNSVAVLLGDGKGGFEAAPGSPFDVGSGSWGVAVGDVNGDERSDIVTSNQETNNTTVLLGHSNGCDS